MTNASDQEEEEVYEEARPKKRRRKKERERERDQPTYTQAIRTASTRKTWKREVDEDGWQVLPDDLEDVEEDVEEDGVKDTPIEAIRKRQLKRNVAGMQVTDWRNTNHDDDGYETRLGLQDEPEIANSSSQVDVPDVQMTEKVYRTPRKSRFVVEIPSSQSPASMKVLSTQRSQRYHDVERSPLKERSVNVRSPMKRSLAYQKLDSPLKTLSGNTQSPVRRSPRLQQMHDSSSKLRPSPLKQSLTVDTPVKATSTLKRKTTIQDSAEEELDSTSGNDGNEDSPPKPPSTLKRKTTVQGSQYEELQPSSPPTDVQMPTPKRQRTLKRIATVQDSQYEELQPPSSQSEEQEPPPKPQRMLKRVSTVQDSQYEDLDLPTSEGEEEEIEQAGGSAPNDGEAADDAYADGPEEDEYDEGEEDEYDDIQPTYDPAYSALDRDAARFAMQTQTQYCKMEPHVSDSDCSDDEELTFDDREGDAGAAYEASQELGGMSQWHEERGQASQSNENRSNDAGVADNDDDDKARRAEESGHAAEKQIDLVDDVEDEAQPQAIPSSQPTETTAIRKPGPRPELNEDEDDDRVPSSPPPLLSLIHI